MNKGIDYGMGQTNIDKKTGIRFGVIHQNEVLQTWADASEADYGPPTCSKCGNEAVAYGDDKHGFGYTGGGSEYACTSCKRTFDADDAFGEEALGYFVNDADYEAHCGSDGDIFITRSPYYTRAQFCSPCAPGACYLMNPCEDGERAYCFGHDWFESGKAPYPVYSVEKERNHVQTES